jgi:hypothetical protein
MHLDEMGHVQAPTNRPMPISLPRILLFRTATSGSLPGGGLAWSSMHFRLDSVFRAVSAVAPRLSQASLSLASLILPGLNGTFRRTAGRHGRVHSASGEAPGGGGFALPPDMTNGNLPECCSGISAAVPSGTHATVLSRPRNPAAAPPCHQNSLELVRIGALHAQILPARARWGTFSMSG